MDQINQLQFGVLKSLIAFSIKFNLAVILRDAGGGRFGSSRSEGVVSVNVVSPNSCTWKTKFRLENKKLALP